MMSRYITMPTKQMPKDAAFWGALLKIGSRILPAVLRGGKVAAKVAARGGRAGGRLVARHATKATAKKLAREAAKSAARHAAMKAASMAADKVMSKKKNGNMVANAAMPQAS